METPISAEVLHISGILKEWIDWVERGMPENVWDDHSMSIDYSKNPGKFVRGVGLCGSVMQHPRTTANDMLTIAREIRDMFVADGLNPTYPFNQGDEELSDEDWYDLEGDSNQMHLNVGRMWWARKIAALTP